MGRGGLERREGLGDLAGRGVQAAALRRAAGGGGGRAPEGGAGAARDRGGDAQEHDAPEQGARAGALSAGAARAAPGPRGAATASPRCCSYKVSRPFVEVTTCKEIVYICMILCSCTRLSRNA